MKHIPTATQAHPCSLADPTGVNRFHLWKLPGCTETQLRKANPTPTGTPLWGGDPTKWSPPGAKRAWSATQPLSEGHTYSSMLGRRRGGIRSSTEVPPYTGGMQVGGDTGRPLPSPMLGDPPAPPSAPTKQHLSLGGGGRAAQPLPLTGDRGERKAPVLMNR